MEEIIEAQKKDTGMNHIRRRLKEGEALCFQEDEAGVLWFCTRLVVPKDLALRKKILDEAHMSQFSLHPGSTKMYQDLNSKILVDPNEEGSRSVCHRM